MVNYYQVLGVENFASAEEVKAAYRKKSKQLHPDLHNGAAYYTEKFKELQQAYDCLGKPAKREQYDLQLQYYLNNAATSNTTTGQYTYHYYQQTTPPQSPTYSGKEKDTVISGRMFFRILYLAFIVFRMATCNTFNSSEPGNTTFKIDAKTQQLFDSISETEYAKDSLLKWRLTDSSNK